jgi:protein-tyrosine phosphatase
MMDIHCHILPGIDDGARDMETSLEMLRIAERDGINKIIATPHFYRNYYEVPYEEVIRKTMELNSTAEEHGINVKVIPGQEIFLDKYTLELYKRGIIGGLNNSRYMLLELPMDQIPTYALEIIYELKLLGVMPIIAHPERYLPVIKNPAVLNDFIEEECFFQINAGSIKGLFGRKIQSTAKRLVINGICDFVGSDAHSTNRRRPEIIEAVNIIKKYNTENGESFDRMCISIEKDVGVKCNRLKIKPRKSIISILGI